MITAFIGVMGSGKDYRANQLVKEGAVKICFKDALIEMTSELCGFDITEYYDGFKENVVGLTKPDYTKYTNYFSHNISQSQLTEKLKSDFPHVMTGRDLLQRLGTDVVRKIDPDYWCKAWHKAAARELAAGGDVHIVVPDCRFINEAEAILEVDGNARFIFCDYRSDRYNPNSKHESEKFAQNILNSGNYDDGDLMCMHYDLLEME